MDTRKYKNTSLLLLLLIVFPITHFSMQFSVEPSSFDNVLSLDSRGSSFLLETDRIISPIGSVPEIWSLSDTHEPDPASGILNPVIVEQSGYVETGNVSARTDSATNTEQILTIDTDHDWVASTAQVEVTNLEKLYVVNGSFDEGNLGYTINPNGTLANYPTGWSAVSNNTDPEQTQQVSYEDSSGSRFVSVQNLAPETNTGQNEYTHYNDTSVLWNQTIAITPYTEQFLLSFDFLYLKGPIITALQGNFSLQVLVDGESVWKQDLPTLSERGTWYNSGTIPVNITISSETTMFMIGLVIEDTFVVDADLDYDDADDIPDGIVHCEYITVLLDDVSFKGATPPSCEAVDLQFIIDSLSTPIVGLSGSGFGVIENPLYWQTSPLSFSLVSNSSISLDYNTLLLNHRYLNSTPTTNTLQEGVAYSITPDQSGNLEIFTYLGFIGAYENLTIRIFHPSDWQNFTVFDPFLVDVTSNTTEEIEYIELPTTLILDRLGWWKVVCAVHNYAFNASIQRFDVTDWIEESIFHTDDQSRLSVNIGSMSQIPILTDAVNFTYFLPNSTMWHESSTVSGVVGSAESTSVIFGGTNTTAGIWCVSYFWSNGTEIAYGVAEFALHHQAILEVVFEDELETVVGQLITVVLRFFDAENGQYIVNNGAQVVGNWSGTDIEFTPDVVKNWWQADFDTALVGAGEFKIHVVSAAPYFETVPLVITIRSHFLTTLDTPTGPLTPLIFGRQYSFDYFYTMSFNGTGIDDAIVEVTGDGSVWATVTDPENGHYNLTLEPLASRDYSIRITFSKVGYENQTHVLSFLVNDVEVEVNYISTLVGQEQAPITIDVQIVESDTRNLVSGANVTIAIYRPGNLFYFDTLMNETSAGNYSVTITMPQASSETYTLRISIEKANHVMAQDFSSALVPTIDTDLRLFQIIMESSGSIGVVAAVAIAAVAGQRVRSRRRREKHTTAVSIKNRLNDANNILGFLILHKSSGVPIYSKVYKGGFEEGILSAFITAIMHFREEFDSGGRSDVYSLIPISEVIRTIPTENLICAFITVAPPSVEQEVKMISYARAVGMMLDDSLAMLSPKVIDAQTSKTFERLYDDLMDGILIRRYQVGEKTFPKPLRFIEKAIHLEETNGSFNLARLVRLLTSTEVSADDVYIKVFKAIEDEYLLPIYPYNAEVNTE